MPTVIFREAMALAILATACSPEEHWRLVIERQEEDGKPVTNCAM
jgi:hypothetical protein